jgi:hypothetical protein
MAVSRFTNLGIENGDDIAAARQVIESPRSKDPIA